MMAGFEFFFFQKQKNIAFKIKKGGRDEGVAIVRLTPNNMVWRPICTLAGSKHFLPLFLSLLVRRHACRLLIEIVDYYRIGHQKICCQYILILKDFLKKRILY